MTNFEKTRWCLNLLCIYGATSCGSVEFAGGSSRRGPPATLDQSPNNASATIIAKEVGTFELDTSKPEVLDQLTGDFLSLFEMPGLTLVREPDKVAQLRWQTDLQDIGKSMQKDVEFAVTDDEFAKVLMSVHVNVVPPPVQPKACFIEPDPVIGSISPVEKWHWSGAAGGHAVTYSAPVVGDLDQDGSIEVVTIPSTYANYSTVNGPVVVLEGKTGKAIWDSMADKGIGMMVSTTPALVDLDKDGYAEIIGVTLKGGKAAIIAINYKTRSVKFEYSDFTCSASFCFATVADIDGDGNAEISAGDVVLNADGTQKFRLTPAPTLTAPVVNTLADLDKSSPGMEIVLGSQVYSNTGTRLWAGDCHGFSAVADLEKDGTPDLVCIGGGMIKTYTNNTLKWSKAIPANVSLQGGGAPNIGDFDGDGKFEIGTAGGDFYAVFDATGQLLWKHNTVDVSSYRTGSTIFDFNGDGKVEVIYNDEYYLYIFDGLTGTTLWSVINPSGTLWEYPVIANIDEDESVEIVVSSPGKGGVRVFEDSTQHWIGGRALWNQYSYFPEIVDDALQVNPLATISEYGFRVNRPLVKTVDGKIPVADLIIVTPLYFDDSDIKEERVLSFFIANEGEVNVGVERILSLYSADGTTKISSVKTPAGIKVGEGVLVKFNPLPLTDASYLVEIGGEGDVKAGLQECHYDNNRTVFDIDPDR